MNRAQAIEPEPLERFAAVLTALEASLPWEALGQAYCHEGGESFFPPEQVEALRDAGLRFAGDLGEAFETQRLPPRPRGRSLYLGAALAELVPALCEHCVYEREVVLVNVPGTESTLLNAALAHVEKQLELVLPRIALGPEDYRGRFDHLWMTSVLSDPEAFPALHDALYDLLPRKGKQPAEGKEPTGRGNLPLEKKRARALLRKAIGRLHAPAVLTTSDEEFPLVDEVAQELGVTLIRPQRARLSAIVGDPIRVCSVRAI